MKILITGATGLVGKEIMQLCQERGHLVHYLTTRNEMIKLTSTVKGFFWNPQLQKVDINCLEGVDAIINLAGASVSKRWTPKYKLEIENSRIDSVRLLYKLLSENEHNITYCASASALGIYPSSFDIRYKETNKNVNATFLGRVVHKWEREVDKFHDLGLNSSKLRIGIVLSEHAGALPEMAKPIKLSFGAALGKGNQYQSWIHVKDLARLFLFVTERKLSGIYNAVASCPLTNKAMTKTLAQQLKKPLWLPNIPSFMLKFILGEMATILLESQYLDNQKIIDSGFKYDYDTIEKTLQDCLH